MSVHSIVTLGFDYNNEFIPTLGFDSDWYLSIEVADDELMVLPARSTELSLKQRTDEMFLEPRTFGLTLKPGGRQA